jgi:hypothetical protein
VAAARQERERFPRWGKEKIATLLREEGWEVSTSMVGRILGDLKRRNVLRLPLRLSLSVRRRAAPRPYAMRKPKDWAVLQPGDLIQFDTQKQTPEPGHHHPPFRRARHGLTLGRGRRLQPGDGEQRA